MPSKFLERLKHLFRPPLTIDFTNIRSAHIEVGIPIHVLKALIAGETRTLDLTLDDGNLKGLNLRLTLRTFVDMSALTRTTFSTIKGGRDVTGDGRVTGGGGAEPRSGLAPGGNQRPKRNQDDEYYN